MVRSIQVPSRTCSYSPGLSHSSENLTQRTQQTKAQHRHLLYRQENQRPKLDSFSKVTVIKYVAEPCLKPLSFSLAYGWILFSSFVTAVAFFKIVLSHIYSRVNVCMISFSNSPGDEQHRFTVRLDARIQNLGKGNSEQLVSVFTGTHRTSTPGEVQTHSCLLTDRLALYSLRLAQTFPPSSNLRPGRHHSPPEEVGYEIFQEVDQSIEKHSCMASLESLLCHQLTLGGFPSSPPYLFLSFPDDGEVCHL